VYIFHVKNAGKIRSPSNLLFIYIRYYEEVAKMKRKIAILLAVILSLMLAVAGL